MDLGDVTNEQLNPQPPFFPRCERCGITYIRRLVYSLATGTASWAWVNDCAKPRSDCKGAQPMMVDVDGNRVDGR